MRGYFPLISWDLKVHLIRDMSVRIVGLRSAEQKHTQHSLLLWSTVDAMAELLNFRRLEDPPIYDGHSQDLPAQLVGPKRNESSTDLIQSDHLHRESSGHDFGVFYNPVFQNDEETTDECRLQLPGAYPGSPSRQNSKSSSLSPSDSGIHIPDESASVVSKLSADSGLGDLPGSPTSKSFPIDAKLPLGHDPDKGGGNEKKKVLHDESLMSIVLQVSFPFLVAGIGTCGAGLLLDYVETWDVFKKVTEFYILVPTLLGLKGNLEMTLASRISTQANLGQLDTKREQWSMSWGNMAIVQCQATVLALLASLFAIVKTTYSIGFDPWRSVLIAASALFTASIASLFLGVITLVVVLLSHRWRINPDNVATPIAASLGDVITLGILAAIANHFYYLKDTILPSALCAGAFLVCIPLWLFLSYRNSFVKTVLFHGWLPVILAVIITSVGGYILEFSVRKFSGFTIFQPVINGVAGNLVAVQASRISTYFHRHGIPGSRPPDGSNICISPCWPFFGKTPHARTAKVLMALVIPGHVLFGYGITLVKGGDTVLTPTFLPIYLAAAVIQVALLLYIAQVLIHGLWRWKMDPDNWAIPLMTALGDLSGMAALTSAFFIHREVV